jgi:D-glycero-D-manno-heptose 1,7-bisphosphate phosphatase
MSFLVVLDRDGVINEDLGYVHKVEDFVWKEGIFDVLRLLQGLGGQIHVATNQSGIARGMYTREQFLGLSQWMIDCLLEQDIKIGSVQFCEHVPSPDGKPICSCRKPNPGMLLDVVSLSGLAHHQAVMIGDQLSDSLAAKAAGFGGAVLIGRRDQGGISTEGFSSLSVASLGELKLGLLRSGLNFFKINNHIHKG